MELKLGSSIKRLRNEKNITQEELANFLGVSFQAVSKWECGTTTPDISLLPRIAVFFGVTIDNLFAVDREEQFQRIDHILWHEKLTEESFNYAKRTLQNILEEDNNAKGLSLLGQLYLHKSQNEKRTACTFLERAISQTPNNLFLYDQLCQARNAHHDVYRSGCEDFIRFCEPYAKYLNNKINYMMAQIYINLRNFDSAKNMIDSIEQNSNKSIAQLLRGDIELMLGNRVEACKLWESAPKFNTVNQDEDFDVFYSVAGRFERIRCYDKATEYYIESIKETDDLYKKIRKPRLLSSAYSLAFLYTKLGEHKKAIEMWERIIDIQKKDWGIIDGEQVNWPKNEIEKLKKAIAEKGI